jgi:hypothetical protein
VVQKERARGVQASRALWATGTRGRQATDSAGVRCAEQGRGRYAKEVVACGP